VHYDVGQRTYIVLTGYGNSLRRRVYPVAHLLCRRHSLWDQNT
jgi:hypothetical protein